MTTWPKLLGPSSRAATNPVAKFVPDDSAWSRTAQLPCLTRRRRCAERTSVHAVRARENAVDLQHVAGPRIGEAALHRDEIEPQRLQVIDHLAIEGLTLIALLSHLAGRWWRHTGCSDPRGVA